MQYINGSIIVEKYCLTISGVADHTFVMKKRLLKIQIWLLYNTPHVSPTVLQSQNTNPIELPRKKDSKLGRELNHVLFNFLSAYD